jgi:drug/metabolite transporter (DMT)-like permease
MAKARSTYPLENRSVGIFWMLATMLCFISLDATMKLALADYSLIQVTWGRFFFATVFALIYCGPALPSLIVSKVPKAQTLRSVFLMTTTWLFNAGVIYVPLTTATTIMYLTPIVTTVLSVLLLHEAVGLRRWLGIAVGFAGALVVVRPWTVGTDAFNTGVAFLLAAAVTNAAYQIATRSVRQDDPRTSLLFTAAVGAVTTSIILPFSWRWPDLTGWLYLVGSGFFGALGHFCIIRAFRAAPASVVAPFSYSSLVWATLFGFAIWGDLPDRHVLVGATLIIASGLYIFFRERQRNLPPQEDPGQV